MKKLARMCVNFIAREVRKEVLRGFPIRAESVESFVTRTRDVNPDFRATAVGLLAQRVPITLVNADTRGVILWEALQDRSETVRAAAKQLVSAWFHGCDRDPLKVISS